MATDPLALETAARIAADDALDQRLKKLEPVVPPVVPPVVVPPASSGAYGVGLMGDSRANLQVGWTNRSKISYRFRATVTGLATSFRVQERGGPVYSGGNGGTIKATLQTDSGGVPSGSVLGQLSWSPGNPKNADGTIQNWEVWTLHTFPTPVALTAGQLYHLVFENTAADPVANYISLNGLFHFGSTPTPRTAAFSDDFAFMYAGKGVWAVQVAYVPIFDLAYQNGRHDGSAYIGTLADRFGTVNGSSKMVRELFTVTGGDRTVSKAHVRLKRISGTGELVVRLERAGTILGSSTVPANQIAVGAPPPGNLQGDTWAHVTFPAPVTLVNGQAYALRLSTDAATTYTLVPLQQGTSKGLQSRVFADGDGQRTTDAGANWANLYPYDSVDLQFWLD